jgi:hypothetical protein
VNVIGCQIELKTAGRGQGAADKLKKGEPLLMDVETQIIFS